MVFLCHYRNKLIFGFKSEGGGVGATCVRRRKRRDVTVAGVLNLSGVGWGVCTVELSV